MRRLFVFPVLLLLTACGTPEKIERGPVQHKDGNVGVDVAAVQGELQAAREAEAAAHKPGPDLGFGKGVSITPQQATVEDTLAANAPLADGVDAFAEVSYTWYVNGVRVSGVTRGTLKSKIGRFERGDTVYFVARVENREGHSAELASKPIEIRNAKPVMLSDVSDARGLNGLRLKAKDADGDKLHWSVEGGPPGISIEPNGRIRVRTVDLKEAFSGEVVFVAEDSDGARAELHIPVSVNAAQAARTEVTEVKTLKRREDVTDAEFERANLEAGERVEKMTPEEFDRYIREQERRSR